MNRLLFFLLLLCATNCFSQQQQSYNFHKVDAMAGLADGVVGSIGQDKYGYIWVGTLSGLNRFDGYTVKTFYHNQQDSFSVPAYAIRSILCDKDGNLWLGANRGLVRYDYATSRFIAVPGTKGLGFFKMLLHHSGSMFMHSNLGLVRFEPATQKWQVLAKGKGKTDSLLRPFNDMVLDGDLLYLATNKGVVLYNVVTRVARWAFIPPGEIKNVESITKDRKGNIWYTTGEEATLFKTDASFASTEEFTQFQSSPAGVVGGAIANLLVDAKDDLWVTTNMNGLGKFNPGKNSFEFYRSNPSQFNNIGANLTGQIYQDKKGFIWIGTEGNGLSYFHPDNNLFSILPLPTEVVTKSATLWARSIVIDHNNNYWMSFGGSLLRMKRDGTDYTLYTNYLNQPKQLHNISIRSLLFDDEHNVWIGTREGLNCYTPKGEMKFYDEKDSISKGFFWHIYQDSRKTIWFSTAGQIFYRDTVDRKFHSLVSHPALSAFYGKGARVVFEDSKKRLWFGMNGAGLVMYDPASGAVKNWQRKNGNDTTVINNTISSIVEDRTGVIWFTSFTGLTSYNPATNRFRWYTHQQGFPSIKLSGIKVDKRNNLWMGSTKGLLVFDASRKTVRTFDLQDGLPTMEFSDMNTYETPEGDFIYPTLKGFILFSPDRYAERKQILDVFLSEMTVSGNHALATNSEDFKRLNLSWDQNFFSFRLTAFNYNNPDQTWYAYKLEGFDQDWIYTKNRVVNYTNVPGGRYTLRYKASDDPNNWKVPEKTLQLHIGTVYYKSAWFWVLIGLVVLASVYYWYTAREQQQRRIYSLQTKAQALEKEKAMVMYENLKQQLNPHFLFNSLTSLGSLIKVDQKLASQFLEGMSKIYRYILKSRDHEVVSLGEEVKFVENYIRLQQTRFETGLQVNIAVPEDEFYKKIAPVTLQNLLENAIKHNIIDDESPLVIDIYIEDNYLVTRNNLQRKNFVDTSNKQGLRNLQSLYRYLTRKPVIIEENQHYYIIKIPLI